MSGRVGLRIVAAMAMLGSLAASSRVTGATVVRSTGSHGESAGIPALQGQCLASAGFKRGSVADHGTVTPSGRTITLEAGDSYFEPTCETGVPMGEVEVQVRNIGRLLHNISLDAGIDQDIAPGETVRLKVTMAKAPLQFSCKYHRGAGMVGAMLPGSAATPRRKE